MNRKHVNILLPKAKKALEENDIGIVNENGELSGKYRTHISTFNANVLQIGLKQTIKLFSSDDDCDIERYKLLGLIYYCLKGEKHTQPLDIQTNLYQYIDDIKDEYIAKTNILEVAVALKNAMNNFCLIERETKNE